MTYPTELIPTANGVISYVLPPRPEGIEEADWTATETQLADAQARPSPVDKIVGAFDALKGRVADLDTPGLRVLASCAQQIVLNGFHQKQEEALAVRDAAVAALG